MHTDGHIKPPHKTVVSHTLTYNNHNNVFQRRRDCNTSPATVKQRVRLSTKIVLDGNLTGWPIDGAPQLCGRTPHATESKLCESVAEKCPIAPVHRPADEPNTNANDSTTQRGTWSHRNGHAFATRHNATKPSIKLATDPYARAKPVQREVAAAVCAATTKIRRSTRPVGVHGRAATQTTHGLDCCARTTAWPERACAADNTRQYATDEARRVTENDDSISMPRATERVANGCPTGQSARGPSRHHRLGPPPPPPSRVFCCQQQLFEATQQGHRMPQLCRCDALPPARARGWATVI
jgi:hypothetical protein